MKNNKIFYKIGMLISILLLSQNSWSQDSSDNILDMDLEDLMNIQITVASKSEEKISDAPGVISVVTKEELARFGGISLKDILERVPSLTALNGSFTDRNALASRGDMVKSTSSHILILIDGRPTREIVEGGIISDMMGAFPVNIIERIEVIRGPGSVLYGSMAMAAVINIVTKPAERNNVAYTEIFGKKGTSGRTVQAQYKKGDFNATIAGRMLKKAPQSITADVITTDRFGTPIDTTSVSGIDESKALGLYANVEYKGLHATASLQEYQAMYFQQGVFDENTWNKNFYNIGYDFSLGEKWKSSINTTYNYATLRTGGTPDILRTSRDFVAEWTNYFKLGERTSLILGGLYNHSKGNEASTVENDSFKVGDEISNNSRGAIAIYSQVDYWAIEEKVKVIGGFQANKMEDLELDIVPRLGAVWYITPRLNLKTLYAQAYRAGTINETGIDYQGFFVGNPDIKPEHIENFDLGLNYQGKKWNAGVNFFHSVHSNSITQGGIKVDENGNPETIDIGGGNLFPVQTYQNIDEYSFGGLEVEGKYYINDEIFLTGSALYQRLSADDSTVFTRVADLSFKAGLSYASKRGLTISLFNIYNSSLDNDQIITDGLNNDPKQAYNIMNLYVNLDMVKLMKWDSNKRLSLFVQQENLLNESVWLPESLTTSAPYNGGRAIYFGLTVGL